MTRTSSPNAPRPPWQQRQLPYALKFVITFLAVLAFFTAFVFALTWMVMVPQMILQGPGPRDTVDEMVKVGLILTGGIVVFGSVTAALWPFASAPARFTPKYGTLPATVLGQPFEVNYQKTGWGRSLTDKGMVRFDANGLVVTGNITPSPLVQIIVIITFTIIPLIIFKVGLGFIPAVLLANYLGRKHIIVTLPYHELTDLLVQGCRIIMRGPGIPKKISFVVASVDGERFYRELLPHFPGALGGWCG